MGGGWIVVEWLPESIQVTEFDSKEEAIKHLMGNPHRAMIAQVKFGQDAD